MSERAPIGMITDDPSHSPQGGAGRPQRTFVVGGWVRDTLLGRDTKDVDFTVEAPSFDHMRDLLTSMGAHIWLEHPEHFTIRAHLEIPDFNGVDADFVLARSDGTYSDGRRPDSVEIGTILDDLARRDFTVNAIAVPLECMHRFRQCDTRDLADVLDPHGGVRDLLYGTLRTVGDPQERFEEDGLRIIRALRFMVTHALSPTPDLEEVLQSHEAAQLVAAQEIQRIQAELHRALRHNTTRTIDVLCRYRHLQRVCLRDGLWLMPTMRKAK